MLNFVSLLTHHNCVSWQPNFIQATFFDFCIKHIYIWVMLSLRCKVSHGSNLFSKQILSFAWCIYIRVMLFLLAAKWSRQQVWFQAKFVSFLTYICMSCCMSSWLEKKNQSIHGWLLNFLTPFGSWNTLSLDLLSPSLLILVSDFHGILVLLLFWFFFGLLSSCYGDNMS